MQRTIVFYHQIPKEGSMADTEQFNDFKEPISPSNYVDPTIEGVFNKELSEVEAFKAEFDETLEMSDDPKKELTETIVGYIQGLGDVNQVNLYSYDNGNGVALDGWAFNGDEDLTSLDLFLTVYVDPGKSSKISATELDRHFNWLYRFYDQSLSGVVFGKISDTKSDLYRIADIIHSAERVDRVRLFLMTNAIAPSDYDKNNTEIGEGTICEYVIWDAKRVMRQNEIISGKSSIIVNFEADYNSPLPCIQMPDVSENVRCYLCVISGNVLAQIYHKHHQQILEQNVRTFLQFKGASNKGIRDTMIGHTATKVEKLKGVEDTVPEPDMFFAYNNGISTTASDIEVRPTDNGYEITQIKDWQIVNGGQTTASISAVLSMKNVDFSQLAKVFVPMKVSVIKNKDQQSLIVHKISKFANTPSAVKKSDFNINEFHLSSDASSIIFSHETLNGIGTLPEELESHGTLRFMGIAAIMKYLVQDNQFIIIDEIETSLHYELLSYFLRVYLANNTGTSQLLIATHDINLLNEDFVRRDTIWFTDKNEEAETELVRLSDLGLHKNISPYNAYRQGKLVKLPFTGAIYLDESTEDMQ